MTTATLPTTRDTDIRARSATGNEVEVRCKISSHRTEREAAFRLIYESYVEAGLSAPNACGMRVTPYHLLPTTTIFNAYWPHSSAGDPLATVTLVIDGELGLPMESVYPEEIGERVARGWRLAEVSCLAERRCDGQRFQGREFFSVFCQLNRLMIQFARHQQVDQVLVAVHPRHARFYTRYMGFEEIGGLAAYPTVQNRPAVALCYDFERNDRQPFPFYERFFDEPIPAAELQPQPMSAAERAHFEPLIDASFATVTAKPRRPQDRSVDELSDARQELLCWIMANELQRKTAQLVRSA